LLVYATITNPFAAGEDWRYETHFTEKVEHSLKDINCMAKVVIWVAIVVRLPNSQQKSVQLFFISRKEIQNG